MQRLISILGALGLGLPAVLTGQMAVAEGQADVNSFRCEAYCSQTKLRTVNAKLTWIGPGMPLGPSALADRQVEQEQIETTVFKNGFKKNLHASFSTLDPDTPNAMAIPGRTGSAPMLPAYNLKLIGAQQPIVSGAAARASIAESPEKQERSVIVEGLEPGLTYRWRLRFRTVDGWTESQTIACEAPVCPADLQEE